ncbi:MAG: two-component sensor histidine kinase [Gordonia sp.]|nr:two-component sensor histidine kinase [Gordonia sp. (in: high G+C Gram-positive bacteria)]
MRALLPQLPASLRTALGSVRGRLTILATTLLAVALALAGIIMLFVLNQSLLGSADSATSSRAQEVSTTISTDGLPGLNHAALALPDDLDVIQIVDARGRVLVSNPAGRRAPLVPPIAAGDRRTVDGATFPGSDVEYRLTAVGVSVDTGDLTIIVAAAEGPIHTVLLTVFILLCVVFPLILLLLIFVTYYFVGRALRPVEHIRAQVAAISSSDLSRRLPVPPTNDEISTLATTMNDMLGGLEDARRHQLRFVGDASHELRSPLMTLVGLLDLSRTTREPIDPETVEDILLPEARRLETMIDDLLLLAKADERGVPLQIRDVDLDEIVSEEASRLTALTPLDIQVTLAPVRVRGDAEKLSRAVRNIADNAARHARSSVHLTMASDNRTGTAAIAIIDDGHGIADQDKDRVFDRFVRLDAGRERSHGGSGLGMSIVTEIIRAHGGTVVISDTPDGGTTVTIAVPMKIR